MNQDQMKHLFPVQVLDCDRKEELKRKHFSAELITRPSYSWDELEVTSSDVRVYVAAPMPFFEWWKNDFIPWCEKLSHVGTCACECFIDLDSLVDEDGDSAETIESYFWFNGELWVDTDEDRILPFKQWIQQINDDIANEFQS